ncbi:LacI family transcriptional regulator [Actinomadura madurae]|nr:LacI family DNA-binding transcriptional regulator [Actinomadura madurae]MCQ0019376.1 LacI family transcriptional regulator [Actinomadura madurae]
MAREAAVSPATVSRVLSGAKAVSADLERRVRAAVERLGYRPNPAAQGLLRGATHTIGMVVPDLSNPYFAEVLKGVTAAAEAADFRTLVSDTGENAGAEYAAALELSRWTDGVVLSSPRMTDEDLAALADRAPRLVCVNRLLPGRNVPAVVVDFEAGMAALCGTSASWGTAASPTCAGRRGRGRSGPGSGRCARRPGPGSRSSRWRAGRATPTGTARRTPPSPRARPPSSPSATMWRWGCWPGWTSWASACPPRSP